MPVTLSPLAGAAAQLFDNNGTILSGGKLYSYAAGTTTPQPTYTSNTGGTAHANPIILDSAGRIPGGEIWLDETLSYKFVLYTSTDILIGTYDNISNVSGTFSAFSFNASYPAGSVGAVLQDAAFVFPSIAALRANTASGPNTSAIVQGYYAPGDQGAGVFDYDAADTTSLDNNGTIIVDAAGRRWKRQLPDGSLNPQMFGAKADLIADDTAAIQDMFDAADDPAGNLIQLLGGQMIVSSTIYIANPVRMVGPAGQMQSLGTPYAAFVMINATANLFEITHSQANHFESFGIRAGTTRTAGYDFVLVGDGVNQPIGTIWEKLNFNGSFGCISIPSAKHWKVVNCGFYSIGYSGFGNAIFFPSTATPDSGDIVISGNDFISGVSGTTNYGFAAIYIESTPALQVTANKFFGFKYGIYDDVKATSGNLLVSANSFEQQAIGHIDIRRSSGSAERGNIAIVGNEFSQLNSVTPPVNPTTPAIFIQAGTSRYIFNVIISNNVFNYQYTNAVGIVLIFDGENVICQGNAFSLNNATQPWCFQTDGNAANVQLLDNVFFKTGAGQKYKFLNNTTIVRDMGGLTFADLGTWGNGSQIYVTNGTPGTPVTGGGPGSMAFRINTNWVGI